MRCIIRTMTPEEVRAEIARREKTRKRIKFWTIKIPAILALLFIIWMFVAGGSYSGVPAILVTVIPGIPWCLFWNWIANMEIK